MSDIFHRLRRQKYLERGVVRDLVWREYVDDKGRVIDRRVIKFDKFIIGDTHKMDRGPREPAEFQLMPVKMERWTQ